jgi:predicted permease
MDIVLAVLQIVAPVFILATIGYAWVRFGLEYRVQFVTRLAMTLAVPCLIFTALQKTTIDPAALTTVVAASAVAYGVLTLVAYLAVRLSGLSVRTFLAPVIFGNTGNLGLPLALFAFGDEGLGFAVVIFAVMAIYSFTFGVWVVSGGGSPFKVVKEPMVAATLLGAVFLYNGWHTPVWLTNTLQLIGQMAIPLMLITLGVAVARLHPAGMSRAFVIAVAKVVIAVAVGWGVGLWFALPPVPFAVLVLQISTPVAVTSYMLAEKYAPDPEVVAGLVVASTLVSVMAIPVTLAFLL